MPFGHLRKCWKLELIFKSGTGLHDWFNVVASQLGCVANVCPCWYSEPQLPCKSWVAEAKYASCHQASTWVLDYIKACNCCLARRPLPHFPTHYLFCPLMKTLSNMPQGLEEDHWQRLQLEKVLQCNLAFINGRNPKKPSGCKPSGLSKV